MTTRGLCLRISTAEGCLLQRNLQLPVRIRKNGHNCWSSSGGGSSRSTCYGDLEPWLRLFEEVWVGLGVVCDLMYGVCEEEKGGGGHQL